MFLADWLWTVIVPALGVKRYPTCYRHKKHTDRISTHSRHKDIAYDHLAYTTHIQDCGVCTPSRARCKKQKKIALNTPTYAREEN